MNWKQRLVLRLVRRVFPDDKRPRSWLAAESQIDLGTYQLPLEGCSSWGEAQDRLKHLWSEARHMPQMQALMDAIAMRLAETQSEMLALPPGDARIGHLHTKAAAYEDMFHFLDSTTNWEAALAAQRREAARTKAEASRIDVTRSPGRLQALGV